MLSRLGRCAKLTLFVMWDASVVPWRARIVETSPTALVNVGNTSSSQPTTSPQFWANHFTKTLCRGVTILAKILVNLTPLILLQASQHFLCCAHIFALKNSKG